MNRLANPKENRRILIVDDYEMTCITVAMFFEELGYICDIAHTAKQALELAAKNKNLSVKLVRKIFFHAHLEEILYCAD
jgi:CheY-like chemotaxis protein